jgi:hypothetical protein
MSVQQIELEINMLLLMLHIIVVLKMVAIFLQKINTNIHKNTSSQIIIESINLSSQYIVRLLLFAYIYSTKQQFTDMNAHLETSFLSIHFAPSSPKLFLSSLCNVTPPPGICNVLEGQFMPSLQPDGVWLFCRPCAILSIMFGNLSKD